VKKMERTLSYGMREDVVSDCEEWSSKYRGKAFTATINDTGRNGECVRHMYCANLPLIFLVLSLVDILSRSNLSLNFFSLIAFFGRIAEDSSTKAPSTRDPSTSGNRNLLIP
jgi:hypothetical protein